MQLSDELLAQAQHLASIDLAYITQADLRRSVSASYYSLFHFLIAEAVRVLVQDASPALRAKVGRAFQHGTMADVCRDVADGRNTAFYNTLLPGGSSEEIKQVARAFTDLDKTRQLADYDVAWAPSLTEALTAIGRVSEAFSSWNTVHDSSEAKVFLYSLLLAKQWSRT